MADWAWVALGYGITGSAVISYLVSLHYRAARVQRHCGETR
ncbi:hypothetical protein [Pseudonocardia sp. KRD291]|nr:hypothetical protein [Pseudonocardia sp. KRD291]